VKVRPLGQLLKQHDKLAGFANVLTQRKITGYAWIYE